MSLNRGEQLAKRYWQKLFKEYCICDLSRYKENKACLPFDGFRCPFNLTNTMIE